MNQEPKDKASEPKPAPAAKPTGVIRYEISAEEKARIEAAIAAGEIPF